MEIVAEVGSILTPRTVNLEYNTASGTRSSPDRGKPESESRFLVDIARLT